MRGELKKVQEEHDNAKDDLDILKENFESKVRAMMQELHEKNESLNSLLAIKDHHDVILKKEDTYKKELEKSCLKLEM